jgi:hypothetical protein
MKSQSRTDKELLAMQHEAQSRKDQEILAMRNQIENINRMISEKSGVELEKVIIEDNNPIIELDTKASGKNKSKQVIMRNSKTK